MSPRCGWHVVALLALCLFVKSAWATDFGRQSYLLNCAGCHLHDGRGSAPNDVPSLHGAPGHLAGIPEGRAWPLPVYYLRLEIELISGAADFNEAVARICFPQTGAREV
jgi:hypothetical protein